MTTSSSPKQPLNLIVYPSPLFAEHWAFFLPSTSTSDSFSSSSKPATPHLGTRIHADGSPLTRFTLLIEEDYDLKSITQNFNVIELQADVDSEAFMRVAKRVGVPGKCLIDVGEAGYVRNRDMGTDNGVEADVVSGLFDQCYNDRNYDGERWLIAFFMCESRVKDQDAESR